MLSHFGDFPTTLFLTSSLVHPLEPHVPQGHRMERFVDRSRVFYSFAREARSRTQLLRMQPVFVVEFFASKWQVFPWPNMGGLKMWIENCMRLLTVDQLRFPLNWTWKFLQECEKSIYRFLVVHLSKSTWSVFVSFSDTSLHILLIEEMLHHLGWKRPCK